MKNLIILTLLLLSNTSIAQSLKTKAIYNKAYCSDSLCKENIQLEFTEIGTNKTLIFTYSKDPKDKYKAQVFAEFFDKSKSNSTERTVDERKDQDYLITYDSRVDSAGNEFLVMEKVKDIPDDNYPKATCKVYDEDGLLRAIVEDNTAYKISSNKKSMEKPIQNKNEFCKSSKCLRVTIASNFVKIYNLPNTTDARTEGKVSGNKIYSCKNDDCSETGRYIEFKGDKTQAAIIAIWEQFFR